jgi:hypothetical protein
MTETNSNQKWVIWGKTSAGILASLAAVATIYSIFRPSEYDLTARCTRTKFIVPPDYKQAFSIIRENESYKNIKEIITEVDPKANQELSYIIRDMLEKKWPTRFKSSIPSYSTYWVFEIQNTGKLPLEEVSLNHPGQGVMTITGADDQSKSDPVNRIVNLGTLKPNDKIILQVWDSKYSTRFDEELVTLSHKTGLGKIKFSTEVFGIFGWLDRYASVTLFLGLLCLVTALNFFGLLLLSNKPLSRSPRLDGPINPITKDSNENNPSSDESQES